LENVSGILFPPGMMGTILPSALWPTKESRGIIYEQKSKKKFYYGKNRKRHATHTIVTTVTKVKIFKNKNRANRIGMADQAA
jgi:hypothetical protein